MPQTEAGKRLLEFLDGRPGPVSREVIAAIEDEAEHRGYLRANDCDHSPCIEREAEAVATERERITREVEGVEHPCHEVCIGDLHADCQCAAWMREQTLAIVNPEAEK